MAKCRFCLIPAVLFTSMFFAFAPEDPRPDVVEDRLERNFFLILRAKCYSLHGDKSKKMRGGLDLTSRESMLHGGDSGRPALVPGEPLESLVYLTVIGDDPDLVMPPEGNDKLTSQEVDVIRQWIEQGA